MTYNTLSIEHRGRVTWLYINRPEALNTISMECMRELRDTWQMLGARKETRVIVLSGKGRSFCAGADLSDASADADTGDGQSSFLALSVEMEAALAAVKKPIIAAVNGVCCGGGLEMALMCDFIIAAVSAKIGDAHANVGVLPGGGATLRLPRIIGVNRARYLMYSGELLPASELVSWGLVIKSVPAETFEAEVQAVAERMAEKSPIGLARMKQLLSDGFDMPAHLAIANEKRVSAEHMCSADAVEGRRAFFEKRKPEFRDY